MSNTIYYVYRLKSLAGQTFYYGMTSQIKTRKNGHKAEAKSNPQRPKNIVLQRLLERDGDFILEILHATTERREARAVEMCLIKAHCGVLTNVVMRMPRYELLSIYKNNKQYSIDYNAF